ncbi:DUF58 domain-containing protein [Nocardioides sp.]|uniref:DUF58 domain-containing protein n=1 Tax=Nocardioides sp. TaxID=35761 RepID=UPI002ED641F4
MLSRLRRAAVAVLAVVNPLGWMLLGLAVLLLLAARSTGWLEASVVAAACLIVIALALPFLLGRTSVRVDLRLEPQRVTAGDSVVGSLRVTNIADRRLLPTLLEVPVGSAVHRYPLPSLAAGGSHEESFTIRTRRRGVIAVGPALTRRGDPLGAFSRDVGWTPLTEILVRPPMTPLESLAGGLLRDLEGVTTDAVTASDLAFHALREYVPGDDLRHVHWRSSAKAMASASDSQLLVRQYLDTRRSHATIVVDDRPEVWRDEDEFELAMSVAASISIRALVDEFEVSFVCGEHAVSGGTGPFALDAVCRAEQGRRGVVSGGHDAARMAPDTSLLFLVGGRGTTLEEYLRAASSFAPEVRRYALAIDPTGRSRVTDAGGMPVLHLAELSELAAVLRWSLS